MIKVVDKVLRFGEGKKLKLPESVKETVSEQKESAMESEA